MKLLRLKLNDSFRSLHNGFEVDFLNEFYKSRAWDFMPYCLVGKNGCGKSNILELLAAIFYHIECIYLTNKPDGFDGEGELEKVHTGGFFAESCTPDAFEIEYLIPVPWKINKDDQPTDHNKIFEREETAHIQIIKKRKKAPIIKCLNKQRFDTENKLTLLNRREVKEILPDFVVGYSSGENEILSLPFFKMRFLNYDEYVNALREETGYSQPEGRFVYIDTQLSQAVFLTNFLMQEEKLLKPIYNTIGIEAITQFRIIINQDIKISKFQYLEKGVIEDGESDYNQSFELTELLKTKDISARDLMAIDKLQCCSTTQFFDSETNTLYLDYLIDRDIRDNNGEILQDQQGVQVGLSEMKKAFRAHFDNDPFALFRALQILLTLNLYDVSTETKVEVYMSESLYVNETVPILSSDKRIMRFKDFTVKKKGAVNEILSKSLSDGEHQFLHAMGICLLFKDSNSLFLLDEPETHFNPEWRAQFISTLKECLRQSSNQNMRDILLSSHSPFIISDSIEDNVLIFKRNKDKMITVERPDFNTFGASVNRITMDIFERDNTIGDLANSSVENFEIRHKNGEDPKELIKEINNTLGESVEKTILINRVKGFI
ncbi:ABC transporter [Chryseobacterium pennae]|uniref:ABC transporter n=1 Tax=Chryseobacterium pennae TaxID=2258962 RepID=A0A3D9C9D2_9FLAO|nr:restriction system-associated AAA family ATPase [Chryseobacterium pennae]REC62354.1 ABC transporter [Chryseobacterium pennae]